MVEGGAGTEFPVIFFDGEREINIGTVKVEAKQVYKSFQFMLAHKIGISPNQISIYLIDRKIPKWPETRRKFPITARANFSQICREKECSFLVVLKRSRKTRTRKTGASFPENVVLLRRDHAMNVYNSPFYDPYGFPRMEEAFPMMMVMPEEEKEEKVERYFCEECRAAEEKGVRVDFHPCVNDVVVEEFRVAGAGPIGPSRW